MTDAEFVRAALALTQRPITEIEERWHGVQCADDAARVYMARLYRLIARYRSEQT